MAWSSGLIATTGNTTLNWAWGIVGGGSHHDVVVVGPEAGTSHIEIERLMVRASPLRYQVTTRVTGAGAVTFRFYGQQIN